ncbi:MAG: hypothetical protein J7623_02410 [Chitinophaga sp.]|uniref:hypothetical protein n=1 Tax=Chitinophaga sp. TaxID=1869181 RepID=UPI001B1AF103|nr:hypothetical protein [Chitinophaga sp.]MBO9727472.1 hypothetical protein [Chitinophaga sp.]
MDGAIELFCLVRDHPGQDKICVLVAGMSSIVALLSKDFLILVILSVIVATPVARYWLRDVAFHAQVS